MIQATLAEFVVIVETVIDEKRDGAPVAELVASQKSTIDDVFCYR